jgi:hypothetical protein
LTTAKRLRPLRQRLQRTRESARDQAGSDHPHQQKATQAPEQLQAKLVERPLDRRARQRDAQVGAEANHLQPRLAALAQHLEAQRPGIEVRAPARPERGNLLRTELATVHHHADLALHHIGLSQSPRLRSRRLALAIVLGGLVRSHSGGVRGLGTGAARCMRRFRGQPRGVRLVQHMHQ